MGIGEIASLASAAISAGSAIGNSISAGKMNKRGVAYAENENRLMRQFQVDQWNRQNEYNDPSAQMARLKKAGINPHFYFGNGVTNPQTSTPSASGGVQPNLKAVDFSGANQIIPNMLQSEMMKAQIDNIKADTDKKNQETTGQSLQNGITLNTLRNQPTTIDLDNQAKQLGNGRTAEEIELTKAKVQNEKQDLITKMSTNEKIREEINLVVAQKSYTEEQTNNLITAIALTKAKIITEGLNQKNIIADTALKKSQANYNNELAKTQPFIRSNIGIQTATQNAQLKNIPIQGQILEENRQKLNRENYIGNKYDLSKGENSFLQSSQSLEIMKQTYRNLMKDEKFKDLKIQEQEFINANMVIDALIYKPIEKAKEIATPVNTGISRTTNTR